MTHCNRTCHLCGAADPAFLIPGYGSGERHLCCGGTFTTGLHWCGCPSEAHVRMYGRTEDPYARPAARPVIVDHALEELVVA